MLPGDEEMRQRKISITRIFKIEIFKDMKLKHKATSKKKPDLRDLVMLPVFNFQ